MKNLFIAIFTFCTLTSFAQTDTFEFRVIDTVTASKQELYLRARQFVALNFKDSKSVIQMDDKDAGRIICKGIMRIIINGAGDVMDDNYVKFTMQIDVKDNKYRCIFNDFYHDGFANAHDNFIDVKGGDLAEEKPCCGGGIFGIPLLTVKIWKKIKLQTTHDANNFISEFKTEMSKPIKNDDF
jgi:hypothetical protein